MLILFQQTNSLVFFLHTKPYIYVKAIRHDTTNRYPRFCFLYATCDNQAKKGPINTPPTHSLVDPQQTYVPYTPKATDRIISRSPYDDQLYAFWLGQCIANWTGLITKMDEIGGAGKDGRAAGFHTREDWGKPDLPNMWDGSFNDTLSPIIT